MSPPGPHRSPIREEGSGLGTQMTASLIYLASDPARYAGKNAEALPDFYTDEDEALADMKRLAGA